MTLLSRLFRSKPKVLTLDEQIAALASASQAQLLVHISGDGPEALREAALGYLAYGPELLTLAASNSSYRMQLAARKHLARLLDSGSLSLKQLAADVPKQIELVALTSCSAKASLDVIEQISSPTLLLELAANAPTTQIRQKAVEKLDARDELEQLAKLAQNKDKTVYKIAKTKLDTFKAADLAQAQYRAQIIVLIEKVEKLSGKEADHLYKGKLLALQNEWLHDADAAPADLKQRYQAALQVCQTRIAARADIIAKEEENIALDAQAKNFVEGAVADIQQLITTLYSVGPIDEAFEADFNKKIDELTQAVRLAAARNVPVASKVSQFDQLKSRAQNLFVQLKHSGPIEQLVEALHKAENSDAGAAVKNTLNKLLAEAKDFSEEQLPPIVEKAKESVKSWSDRQHHLEQQTKGVIKEVADLTRRGLWAAEQGFVRKARGIYKELDEKRQQIAAQLPAAVAAKVEDLDGLMHKLGDWHEFAVTPKKEQLISQMQGLATSTLAPNDLATKIHELQDQWKELSRGGQQSDEVLWEQFQQASAVAFAPCKDYFERQSQERENNLQKRINLIGQLQEYLRVYDWQNAVWKDVEKTLKFAREEWKTYWPIPRKANKELQEQFDALLDELHGKLKAEYQANKDWKQKIIDEVASLSESVDLAAATEKVKQLQVHWKTLGKSWPKDDQHLWVEFRKHCDAVFEKRKQLYQEANTQREAVVEKARGFIAQLREFVQFSPEQIANAKEQIDEVKAQFEALGELPRNAAKEITSQYHRIQDDIVQALQKARAQAGLRSWQQVEIAAELLRQYELAQLTQGDVATAKIKVEEFIASVATWPSGTLDILQKRFALPLATLMANQAEHNNAIAVLTVRAEILAQKETPDAHKSERLAYQVEQLKNNFGRREDSMDRLFLEWINVPGVADDIYLPALERFKECRKG